MNRQLSLTLPSNPSLDALEPGKIAGELEICGTRVSIDCLNWPVEFPYRPLTVVTAAHSGTAVYLDFLVRCNYLRAENYTDNAPVSEDSCVEFFVAPDPSSPGDYFSIGINCIGAVRATFHSACGASRLCTAEELAGIRRYASVGTRPFREVEGSFIWSVTVAIPLSLLGLEYKGEPLAMKGNFNKCAALTSQPHYLSWAPIASEHPDFHRPEAFAPIVLQ